MGSVAHAVFSVFKASSQSGFSCGCQEFIGGATAADAVLCSKIQGGIRKCMPPVRNGQCNADRFRCEFPILSATSVCARGDTVPGLCFGPLDQRVLSESTSVLNGRIGRNGVRSREA